jgi:hypothetical protein
MIYRCDRKETVSKENSRHYTNVTNLLLLLEFEVHTAVTIHSACCLLHVGLLFRLLFYPADGGNTFLRSIGLLSPDYTVLHPSRQNSCSSSS